MSLEVARCVAWEMVTELMADLLRGVKDREGLKMSRFLSWMTEWT